MYVGVGLLDGRGIGQREQGDRVREKRERESIRGGRHGRKRYASFEI